MSSLIDREDESADNLREMSVSELSGAIKRTVEDRFGLVRVRGEIGRVSRPSSGHIYLGLKDDRAVIDGVMWKGTAQRLSIQPEEGLEVIVTGRVTTYPGQSKYQIVIDRMEPAGVGALMAMLEARRKALEAEGLFDPARKQPIPALPDVIGVVTSPSGAVIRDILHRVSERFPRRVIVWPVPVQGEQCAPAVTAAIRGFNALPIDGPVPRPDVLIVARGGGSLEDLWGFNDEAVVRAVADSAIPLISAVGHETDITLIDHAADLRAPTPTAAAEKAVPVRTELVANVSALATRQLRALERSLRQSREHLSRTARLLRSPETILFERRQRLDAVTDRLPRTLSAGIERRKSALAEMRGSLRPASLRAKLREAHARQSQQSKRMTAAIDRCVRSRRETLEAIGRTLEAVSYLRVLDRGFAVVRDAEGGVLATPEKALPGTALILEFSKGRTVAATVNGSRAKVKSQSRNENLTQIDLFDPRHE